jgi:hypothetical protein
MLEPNDNWFVVLFLAGKNPLKRELRTFHISFSLDRNPPTADE